MVTVNSSYDLYNGLLEWGIGSLRDCLEIGKSGMAFKKISPPIEFTVPLKNGGYSSPIRWYMEISSGGSSASRTTDKDSFKVFIRLDGSMERSAGIKLALSVSDEGGKVIDDKAIYGSVDGQSSLDPFWSCSFKLSSIPHGTVVKILGKFHIYDWTDETKSPPCTSTEGSHCPLKFIHDHVGHVSEYCEELCTSLNKDRKEGINTDAIIKHGEAEYKVHKCVLAIHSDFFKARFSDRWDEIDGKLHTVDMNDPDLTADIIEALLCSTYTGKVESLEMALKLLPVTDKYQFKKLKGICESIIGSQLRKNNVLEIHGLAKDYNAQDLVARCESLVRL